MKTYNKPELNVEKFDVKDIITNSDYTVNNGDVDLEMAAGIEFNINVNGNDEF